MSNTEPNKHTTQKTKKMNTEPTKHTTQKTTKMSDTEPHQPHNTEN